MQVVAGLLLQAITMLIITLQLQTARLLQAVGFCMLEEILQTQELLIMAQEPLP